VLNQVFDSGWTASVNGNPIPSSNHFQFDDFFNAWQVSSIGQLTIKIYYQPQTNYFAGVLISIVTFYGASAYLIAITIKSVIVRRKEKLTIATYKTN
jgi:hypothetical protein